MSLLTPKEDLLKAEFKKSGVTLQPEIINKCKLFLLSIIIIIGLTMCSLFNLSPSSLFLKWESYRINNKLENTAPTENDLEKLKNSLQLSQSQFNKRDPKLSMKIYNKDTINE
jgi:hypothetical protein